MATTVAYVRDPTTVVVTRADTCLVVRPGAPIATLGTVDTQAIADLLEVLVRPVTRAELSDVDDETLEVLVEAGIVWRGELAELEARLPQRDVAATRPCRRIVVGIAGSIAAAGFLEQVIAISHRFAEEVDVVLTAGAQRFVQRAAFESWGLRTWTEMFEQRHGYRVPHVHLAAADLVLVAPASASVLHRIATGACTDLLSLVVAATAAPVVVAPVMNSSMWKNPAVARNVAQLRADGVWVIEPALGFEVAHPDHRGDVGALGFQHHAQALIRTLECVIALRDRG